MIAPAALAVARGDRTARDVKRPAVRDSRVRVTLAGVGSLVLANLRIELADHFFFLGDGSVVRVH